MSRLTKKIEEHPRSDVARAYRLGQASGDNGFMPLIKATIRYFLLKGKFCPTRKEANEINRLKTKLFNLTYEKDRK